MSAGVCASLCACRRWSSALSSASASSEFATGELCHRFLEVLVHLVEEAFGREPFLVGADEQRQILGHETAFDRIDAYFLKRVRELVERRIVVELGAMGEPARPREDRSDRIGR